MVTRRKVIEGGLAGAAVLALSRARYAYADLRPAEIQNLVRGRYFWILIFNWNPKKANTSAQLEFNKTAKTHKIVNYKDFLSSTFKVSSGYTYNNQLSASLEFDGVKSSGSTSYTYHTDSARELVQTSQTDKTIDTEDTVAWKATVGPKDELKMYQLCYESAGISYATDVISTDPEPEAVVDLAFTCRQHILGLSDILLVLANTRPDRENKGEWAKITNTIVQNGDATEVEAFKSLVAVMKDTHPKVENKTEWESINATCQEILNSWDTTDKTLLFKKLLLRLSTISPVRENKREWEAIRGKCNAILANLVQVWAK
jgi:hypothetical protein